MVKKHREYYAAANGYSGFRSYFDEIFDKNKLKGLFILKGGPGTGKSTFMRRFLNTYLDKDFPCDAVYCSSDPKSLDGVIINSSVAILDGTAPHEVDTKLPGALDEIVNLGESWNSEKLKKRRSQIEEINKIKKQNFNSAYKYLAFSGNVHDFKIERLKKTFSFESAEKAISKLGVKYQKNRFENKKILISSFSKYGYKRRDLSGFDIRNFYSVNGNFGEEEILLDLLKSTYGENSFTIFPSPFCDNITEGIYFEKENTVFLANGSCGEKIDAFECLKEKEDAEIDFLNKIERCYLDKSKEFFEAASSAHFMLEDIYKDSMNFDNNEEIYQKVNAKVMKILSD